MWWTALLYLGLHMVHAHDMNELYLIPEITDHQMEAIDLTDGSVEDWRTWLGPPVLYRSDFHDLHGVDGLHDPNDLDFQFWMGWNRSTNRLYVACERFDDVYVNEYQGPDPAVWPDFRWQHRIWPHDSIQFLVDGDHSGGLFLSPLGPDASEEEKEEWYPVQNIQAQAYYVIDEGPREPLIQCFTPGLWVTAAPYGEAGGGREWIFRHVYEGPQRQWARETHRIVYEFAVTPFDSLAWDNPEASKVSPLFAGKVIGFNLEVQDYDKAPGDIKLSWRMSRQGPWPVLIFSWTACWWRPLRPWSRAGPGVGSRRHSGPGVGIEAHSIVMAVPWT